jgi:methyltransferase
MSLDINIAAGLFLGYIIAQRLIELVIARRNTSALKAQGAIEHFPGHYPLIVMVHLGWILAMLYFGHDQDVIAVWLIAYAVLQVLRVWILASIGRRWTTRILTVPGETLVARGPYKYIPHPNYMLVIAEILVAPLVLGLTWVAALFSALNAAVLVIRISAEERALDRD